MDLGQGFCREPIFSIGAGEGCDLSCRYVQGIEFLRHRLRGHIASATRGHGEVMGTSRAGNTRKIQWAVDAYGRPIEVEITGGADQ